jgi:hypothetical protein
MALFKDIKDELLIERTSAFVEINKTIFELVEQLKISSYKDMIRSDRDVALILDKEKQLRNKLARTIRIENSVIDAPNAVKKSFLLAHRLSALYPDTVGDPGAVLTSVALRTFPLFKPLYTPHKNGQRIYASLESTLNLSAEDISDIQSTVEKAQLKIAKKRSIVREIRKQIIHTNGSISSVEVLRLYSLLFGKHPFLPGELELVVTETALYFWMNSVDSFSVAVQASERSESEKQKAIQYVKSVRKFRFEHFSHFPVFAFFDVKEADQQFIQQIKDTSIGSDQQFEDLLNSVIAVEETEKIEKYLIHDSWGHIWQDDLTNVKKFYKELVLISLPLAADHMATADNSQCNITDVIKINASGKVTYDESKAIQYANSILEQKITGFLAPLCAELCADIIEYQFVSSFENKHSILPSSSLFRINPTKLDFAWTDIHFFAEHLSKSLLVYEHDMLLRRSYIDRASLLVKRRYTRSASAITASFDEEIASAVNSFFSLLSARARDCIDTALPANASQMNEYFLLFTNLLQIQSTINTLIENHVNTTFPELKPYQELLVIALLTYFCESPLTHFWNLDEIIAEWAVPFLRAIQREECHT